MHSREDNCVQDSLSISRMTIAVRTARSIRRSFDRRSRITAGQLTPLPERNPLWFNERQRIPTRTSINFLLQLWYVTFAARDVNYACLSVWKAFPFARIKWNKWKKSFSADCGYIPRIIRRLSRRIDKSHFATVTVIIISLGMLFLSSAGRAIFGVALHVSNVILEICVTQKQRWNWRRTYVILIP